LNLWCKSTWKQYLETLPPNFSSVGMQIWLLVLPLGAFHGLDQPQNGWFELYILCDWNCFATFNEGGEYPPLHGKHPVTVTSRASWNIQRVSALPSSMLVDFVGCHSSGRCQWWGACPWNAKHLVLCWKYTLAYYWRLWMLK
jgi:hypothetical protein